MWTGAPWGWGGVAGEFMWVDPARDLLAVFLIQAPEQRDHYRTVIHDMVSAAVLE